MFNQQHRKRVTRDNPEHRLHVAVALYLGAALRPPVFWSSIDHGAGKMAKYSAAMMKARGVRRGLPDIVVIMPQPIGVGLGCLVLGIELKAEAGRVSAEQLDAHADLTMAGVKVAVCRSIDQVEAFLRRHGVPLHAQMMPGGGMIVREAA